MEKRIEVVIHRGTTVIEAFGYDSSEIINGLPSCEAATEELENRLGSVTTRQRKEETAATQCGLTTNLCG